MPVTREARLRVAYKQFSRHRRREPSFVRINRISGAHSAVDFNRVALVADDSVSRCFLRRAIIIHLTVNSAAGFLIYLCARDITWNPETGALTAGFCIYLKLKKRARSKGTGGVRERD